MGGELAVGAQHGGVEAGCALEFAFRAAAGVEVGAIQSSTDGAGWFLLAPEVVMSIAEGFGKLGPPTEDEVLRELEVFPKDDEANQGSWRVDASNNGGDHGGGLLSHRFFWLGEPAEGGVEDDPWIEAGNLSQDLCGSGDAGDAGADIVDDQLSYLYLFLEASSWWDEGEDGFHKLLS